MVKHCFGRSLVHIFQMHRSSIGVFAITTPSQWIFEEALKAITFLDLLKKFGPTQNILGPAEGQGHK